jgi:outer membrane receptor protein involved in Fe transport
MTSNKDLLNLIALSGLILCQSLHAQQEAIHELPPVIVRGDLFQTSIERLPASVTVIATDSASISGSAHFENLLGQIPNMTWAGGTSRPRFLQIRGVGEPSQFGNELPASSIGFIIDGIDFTGIGSVAGLFDVQQVEVLRGPQAAAFGANALAGMVIVETTNPSSLTNGKIEATAGDNDLFSFGIAAGGPLGDPESGKLAYRISLYQYQDNGYRSNRFLGKDDTNARDETTARLKLAWTPAPALEIGLTLLYFNFDNGYDAWSLTNNSFVTTTDEPGRDQQETLAAGIKATWHASDSVDISYLASASDSDLLYSYDWDWSNPAELESIYGPEVYGGTDTTDRTRTVSSHDLRASSTPDAKLEIPVETWVAGIYYRELEEEQLYFGTRSWYRTETASLYGQARFAAGDSLTLTLAGRVEEFRIDYSDTTGTNLESSENPWGGKLSIEFSPVDQQLLYASIDRGYKAGGINLDNDIPSVYRVYSSEVMWNYELGWRATLLENHLRFSATAFYMDREDIQVDSSIQLGDGNTFALYKDNAASGHNYGIELELDWQANDWIRLFANAGFLNTAFHSYRYIDPNDGVTEIVLDNREQGYAPNYTYSAGVEFSFDNGLFIEGVVEGRDSYVFDVANQQSLAAYTLVNLHIGYKMGAWRFVLWSNNLFDESYDTHGFYFANEPPAYDTPRKWVSQGPPRQVGLSIQRSF